jgi:hypothetical protein
MSNTVKLIFFDLSASEDELTFARKDKNYKNFKTMNNQNVKVVTIKIDR